MSKIVEMSLNSIVDFNLSKTNNSSFTKSFINQHKGDVPVYGASLNEKDVSYGHVQDNIDNVQYFDDCLTWNIDGSTAVFYRKGHFSLSEKVIPLIVYDNLKPFVNLDYLRFSILHSPSFTSFDFSRKAGKGKIKDLKILMPVLPDGTYDIEEQRRLAGIYSEIEHQKEVLLKRLYEINELLVQVDKDPSVKYKDIPLNELVQHHNGSAVYTKTWCQKHKGDYPIYSANNFNPVAYIDCYSYDGQYLTYSKNGCAGFITIMKGQFSVNGDRCVMTINEEYEDKIDLLYLKYYLEPIFRSNKKGRLGAFGKNEFTKLNSNMIKSQNISVPIPLTPNGEYDINKQIEIADRYSQIDEMKQGLIDKISNLISINVSPSDNANK